ncbi:MAG: SlyX family protein [Methylococcaceae bacterium]|nr:SlyX family protein [Methylococcaceae bacterium]
MSTDRIIELEIKVAYQEDLVQDLNHIVAQQQQQIDRLDATVTLLHDRIKSLSVERVGSEEDKNERPPHY